MTEQKLPKIFIHPQELDAIGIRYSNSQRLLLEKNGLFPKRAYLSPQKPVYILSELEAWIEQKSAKRGGSNHV